MWRYPILALCVGYFVALAVLGVVVWRANPGPAGQAITGIGIGDPRSPEGATYLSGRRLSCLLIERDGLTGSRCTVAIAGETLEIRGWRNPPSHPNQLGGWCEARYAGRDWPCHVGSPHVHVHWFAYLDGSLGLSEAQLAALRQEYPFENLGEGAFSAATQILPFLTALVVAGGVLAGGWSGTTRARQTAIVALGAALLTLPVTFFVVLFVTGGLWD